MSRDKQIEEMASDFCALNMPCEECHLYKNRCRAKKYATRAYNAGYRKIEEDPFRRCACLALGCDIADDLKREVAEEIFGEFRTLMREKLGINSGMAKIFQMDADFYKGRADGYIDAIYSLAELKKKYTEGGE